MQVLRKIGRNAIPLFRRKTRSIVCQSGDTESSYSSSASASWGLPELESSTLIPSAVSDEDTKLMAKNQTTGKAHASKRDAATVNHAKRAKGTGREILFPTEPTSIPHDEIDRAIDLMMSRGK